MIITKERYNIYIIICFLAKGKRVKQRETASLTPHKGNKIFLTALLKLSNYI